MSSHEPISLNRECKAIAIPSGVTTILPAGTIVRVMQSLGTSYSITTEYGLMYRIDAQDAEGLGLPAAPAGVPETVIQEQSFSEQMVWDNLRTVFDPEIPVNIVDLGLIYSCLITPLEQGGNRIAVKMTMTAPGCGMGGVLKADVENKISRLPDVKEVHVEVVLDPPWNPGLMSEAAKLQLGFDLDYGTTQSSSP